MEPLTRYMTRIMRNGVHWRTIMYQPRLTVVRKSVNNVKNLSRNYGSMSIEPLISTIFNDKLMQSIDQRLQKGGPIPKNDIEQLIVEVQNSGIIPTFDAYLLIKSCGRYLIDLDSKESIQLVQDIWSTLNSLDLTMNVSHYNALLDVYLEKDFDFSPRQFLSMMIEKLVEPNRVTFQRLIAASCKKGDIPEAMKLMEQMNKRGMALTEENFNLLIQGYGEAGDLENAVNILDIMKKKEVNPSVDTEAALMCAYAKKGDIKAVFSRLEKLKSNDLSLCDVHYLEILLTLAGNGHWKQAERFVEQIPGIIHSDIDVGLAAAKLIKLGNPELATELLTSTTADPERFRIRSNLILRSLINTRAKVELVIRMCQLMKERSIAEQPFKDAVRCCQLNGVDPASTLKIMKAWLEAGGEIRDHYFWPVLILEAKANNINGIIDVLKSMINDFKVNPSLITLRDFVIPYMVGSRKEVVEKLQEANIPLEEISIACADRLLIEKKLRKSAILMTVSPAEYPKEIFIQHLAEAINAKDDAKSFVVILRLIFSHGEDPTVYMADVLREVMKVVPDYRPNMMVNLLQELKTAGLSISKEIADEVIKYLGSNITEEDKEVIELLQSGTLTEVPMSEYNPFILQRFDGGENLAVSQSLLTELRNKFAQCIEKGDNERAVAIFKEIDKTGYISASVIAQTIYALCELGHDEEADKYVEMFFEKVSHAKLSYGIALKYVELLLKKNRFQDALIFLNKQSEAESRQTFSKGMSTAVESLLVAAAGVQDLEKLFQLYEVLKSKNFVKMDLFALGAVVKFFLDQKDYDKALEVFKRAVTQYKCAPFKSKLLTVFVKDNKETHMNELSQFCNEAFGEVDTKFYLAIAHLSIGEYQLARKFFTNPRIKVSHFRINSILTPLQKDKNFEAIEELIKISRHSLMDRDYLYNCLLKFYESCNDWQRALDLWVQMQESEILPNQEFLENLKNLLEANKQTVPFVL